MPVFWLRKFSLCIPEIPRLKPSWLKLIKNKIRDVMETLKDLFYFMITRKKYWLMPLIFILVMLSLLVMFSSGSALAPFIYSIF